MVVSTAGMKELRYADEFDDMGDWDVRGGLNWRGRKEAEMYRAISRGTMLVTGERGSGKDLFSTSTAYMNKYYFGRPILLDFLPKRAFGEYSIFDGRVMAQEIERMAAASGVAGIDKSQDPNEFKEFIDDAVADWALEGAGMSLLKNAVLVLSELKRYCNKRKPHNKFNQFVGALNTVVRHLDMLIIGTHVHENEIDRFTFMQYANIRVKCERLKTVLHTTRAHITLSSLFSADEVYSGFTGMLAPMDIDGAQERSFIGFDADLSLGPIDKRFYGLWKSKNFVNLKPVMSSEMALPKPQEAPVKQGGSDG